jgi:predicted metal-dependent hydrolase
MTLPVRASVSTGLKFLHSKAGWVLAHVETHKTTPFTDGTVIPLLGQDYAIRQMPGRGVTQISGTEIQVYSASEFVARRVRDFLRKHLREACLAHGGIMAAHIGKTVRDVKVRDTRSRWGSCSSGGTLTFHWQLVFAPPAILDYLIAHEVAHLKEMNHSPRFWQIVATLCPEHASAKRWLKREGHTLHRYGK